MKKLKITRITKIKFKKSEDYSIWIKLTIKNLKFIKHN